MSRKNKSQDGIVYSTNRNHEYDSDNVHDEASIFPEQQKLSVSIDKKFRGGKTVTLVGNFKGKESEMEELGRKLKSACGVGGTVKDRLIIIQGEHKDKVIKILKTLGYGTK
ncbi:MAG: translation initiation factor [Bacteroidetes bacterium]|nr:MAG: translation initiation factor [Bacteroidota bacterium]REJ99942.1 MAG: translation initiation factor [Bacteroidota bacterium]REK35878.1 MAG: translation initiation factor [Bacteroidota bacterium]REK50645.1 MAG: translation initiation factor [Bacteroidota bacterium]